ncbi:prophage tail fiber N-terminal domain-containing protein [Methylophaga sp.]|uniref:prophage tail fiber N-terminal domain-containing protein n=1 Tax=Methylophaga sp. TaxID=2024840 RepID=UPI003A8E3295
MTIQVIGLLKDSSGAPSPNTPISLLTIKGADGVLPTAVFDTITDCDGSYDFNINSGVHYLAVRYETTLEKVAKITVNTDTPSPINIDDLLGLSDPLTPDQILQVQQLVKQATDAANSASDNANKAAQDKNEVAQNTQIVSEKTQIIIDAQGDVIEKAQQVSEDKDSVTQMLAETEAASQEVASTIPQTVNSSLGGPSGGMVVNRLDANGNQNVMVKIPMFTNKIVNDVLGTNWLPEDDVHPAFKRSDGSVMPWFEVGMYTASNDGNGNPVSAPHKDPYNTIDFDDSKSKCQAMGAGWGLMTNAQWAAITIWCLMNEYQPTGNTNYGQSHDKKFQTAIRQDSALVGDTSGSARTLTGSGPKEWNHNNSSVGIADLVGNVWEWVDGFKIVDGQIITAENSDTDELNWISQSAFLDDGLKLNSERTDTTNTNVTWSSLGSTETYIPNQLLQQLMIEPITETGAALGRLYYNNDGERLPRRGGYWVDGSLAGLGALDLSNQRSIRDSSGGFRPAYFE